MRGIAKQQQAFFHRQLRRRGVDLGKGAYVARRSQVAPGTVIGEFTRINGPTRLMGSAPISIGRYCAIATGVTMISENHDMRTANLQVALAESLGHQDLRAGAPIRVDNNVWIGDRAIVLAGVTIGDGAVIAAASVVTKDVDAFAIVAGVPAKVLRSRFSPAIVEFLQEIAWWDWDRDRIARNKQLLMADMTSTPVAALKAMVSA